MYTGNFKKQMKPQDQCKAFKVGVLQIDYMGYIK